MSRLRFDRGMSLVEMLVAVALSGIVLLAGTALLIGLLKQANTEVGREPAVGSAVDIAIRMMERDVRQATAQLSRDGEYRTGPRTLILRMADDRTVVYHRDGSSLLRLAAGAEDAEYRRRVLVEGVLTAEFSRRTGSATFDIWLWQSGHDVKHRLILARNMDRDVTGIRR